MRDRGCCLRWLLTVALGGDRRWRCCLFFFFPVQRHQPLVFSFSRLLLFSLSPSSVLSFSLSLRLSLSFSSSLFPGAAGDEDGTWWRRRWWSRHLSCVCLSLSLLPCSLVQLEAKLALGDEDDGWQCFSLFFFPLPFSPSLCFPFCTFSCFSFCALSVFSRTSSSWFSPALLALPLCSFFLFSPLGSSFSPAFIGQRRPCAGNGQLDFNAFNDKTSPIFLLLEMVDEEEGNEQLSMKRLCFKWLFWDVKWPFSVWSLKFWSFVSKSLDKL